MNSTYHYVRTNDKNSWNSSPFLGLVLCYFLTVKYYRLVIGYTTYLLASFTQTQVSSYNYHTKFHTIRPMQTEDLGNKIPAQTNNVQMYNQSQFYI